MSRYSDYAKKLAPWVKAKNFVVRHRILLICIASASICVAAALTSTKGIVKDETVVGERITYGQLLSYNASAFLGGVSYEFSPQGEEEWSSVVPSEVGSYKMRAKSANSFGGDYYGGVHYFTIDPYKTTCSLSSTSYAYGEKPNVSVELVGDDKVSSYDIVYDDLSKERPIASIKNLKIENEAGGDVTSNYDITCAESEVKLTKLDLTLTFKEKNFAYDGQRHSLDDDFYTLEGELASGDEIVFNTNSILNVGSTSAAEEGSIKVMHEGDIDVTDHYSITTDYGSLKVSRAPLSLASVSLSKEYDGTPFDKEDYEVAEKNGLQGGDEVSLVYDDQSTHIAPGTYQNHFSYSFSSGMQANYQITPAYGELKITKRNLIVTISGTHVYAGSKFAGTLPSSEVTLSGSGLVDGHSATFTVESEDDCLNNKPNVVAKIVDREGNDVTSYYSITLDSSALSYKKRDVTVKAKDVSFVYDGEEHQGGFECTGLAPGDIIVYENDPLSAKELKDLKETSSDSKSVTKSYSPIVKGIYRAGEDRTKYYNFEVAPGDFTLSARPLSILLSVNRTYEKYGTKITDDLSKTEYELLENTSLVDGHSLAVKISESSNIYTDPKFEVRISDENGNDVSGNYAIQRSENDAYSFAQSQITLSSYQNVSFDYDGTEKQINPTISGLREGDELQWESGYAPSDEKEYFAGNYTFELHIDKIINSSTKEDVSKHYIYESSYSASMTIHKAKAVTATLITSRDYDGTDYAAISWTEGTDYKFKGLKSTDSGAIKLNECPFLNKGTTNFDVTITNNAFNAKVNDCYESITKVNANAITWERSALTVAAKDELNPNVPYSGSSPSATVSVEGLAANDSVTFSCACNGKESSPVTVTSNANFSFGGIAGSDVGTYPLEVKISDVFHTGNKGDAEAYYSSLNAVNGSITITKRPLKIKIYEHGSSGNYDAGNNFCYVTESGTSLAANQTLKFTYELTEEGKVQYVPHIYNSSNVDVTENYSIMLDGSNVFNRIPLTIGYSDETLVYDGQKHYLQPTVTGMPTNCTLSRETVSLKSKPTDHQLRYAGESYTYTPEVTSLKDSSGYDETNLYDVTCVSGTLNIVKRPIHITINGSRTYSGSLFSSSPLTDNEYVITDSGSDCGLASNDSITITPIDDGTGSIIGAADESDFKVEIKCGNENRTANYDIDLTIAYIFEKADVTISSYGGEYTYDAEEHEGRATAYGKGSDDCDITSDCEKQSEAGTYDYTIKVTSVSSSSGADRSAYYNLPEQKDASFTINKADVTLAFPTYTVSTRTDGSTPKDLNAEYKNYGNKMTPTVTGLPTGYRVTDYVFKDGPKTAGTYPYEKYLSSYKIVNAQGEDKTANFNVKITGSFEVKAKLEISVIFTNQTKTYDGKAFDLGDNFFTATIIPNDEKDDFTLYCIEEKIKAATPSDINVGQRTVTMETSYFYLVYNRGEKAGQKVADSEYEIQFLNQLKLTTNQCAITFKTPDLTGYYRGSGTVTLSPGVASFAEGSISVTSLGNNQFACNNGDIITLIPPEDWEFDGPTSENNPPKNDSWSYSVSRNGKDVTSNYDITIVSGTIKVYGWSSDK